MIRLSTADLCFHPVVCICDIFLFLFAFCIFNVLSYIFETVFTRNISLWFSWMFSFTPTLCILFTVVNCHCFGIWFFVLILLNNIYIYIYIYKLFTISLLLLSTQLPNLICQLLFYCFILLIAFVNMISLILSFLYLFLLVIWWNFFSTLHCICVSSAISECLVFSRFS